MAMRSIDLRKNQRLEPGRLASNTHIYEVQMDGVCGNGVSKNCLYEVGASRIPFTKFCEGFWVFVTSYEMETSTNSPELHECPGPSTKDSRIEVFAKAFLCTTALPFRLPLNVQPTNL